MEKVPTKQEMIGMAAETRKQVTSAVVTEEEWAAWPGSVEKLLIPTRSGDSEVYFGKIPGDQGEKKPLIINFHGGGFIKKRTENDELYCRKLMHLTGCRTLDVDYRVAPEHPFPCGIYECYDVVCWAFDHVEELMADPERIFLTGHSAGGNFVAGVCMLLEQENRKKPAAVVLDYPPTDVATDPADKNQASKGKGIPEERARLYNLYYCEKEKQRDPLASPLLAPDEYFRNFPRALFMTAEEDSLREEGEELALRVARQGNEVTIKRFPGARHGFTIYRSAGYEAAVELIARFIKQGM